MRRLFITGERFSPEHAREIGLIDFIVPEEKLDLNIQKYVGIIRSSAPIAINEVKNLVEKHQDMEVETYKNHTVKKIQRILIFGKYMCN